MEVMMAESKESKVVATKETQTAALTTALMVDCWASVLVELMVVHLVVQMAEMMDVSMVD